MITVFISGFDVVNLVPEDRVPLVENEIIIMVDIEIYGGRFQAFDEEHNVWDFEYIH